ncbi:MAG TPA: hypothetical protein VIN71_09890 [Pseudomonadales bacterium]
MDIQEIAVSHNQKKKILRSITDEDILVQDDNGDVVVHVGHYRDFCTSQRIQPLEDIVGAGVLDFSAQYFVFS